MKAESQEQGISKRHEASHGAVLVVGGGIAGVQASLDLADSGFKVYLVEKKPSIGGHMAQLDKTFPTNDCSMCILSPKLVGAASHPNIQMMTLAEVTGISGVPGDFTVTVKKKARFVDPLKCTGCGECIPVCPVSLPSEFDMGIGDRKAIFLPFPQAVPKIVTIDRRGTAACSDACPGGLSAQGYVALIREGKYKEALELIREKVPLPSVCGRICHHPCEQACNRKEIDAPLAIAALKSFIGDFARTSGLDVPPEIKEKRSEKVAIVGAGPAGLTAAYRLALKGFKVKIFEATQKPGGMLWWGIPAYRLPKDVLQAEVDFILKTGAEIEYGTAVGKDISFEKLRKDFDAVFLAIGAHKSLRLNIEGEDLDGVIHGIDFLRKVIDGEKVRLGKKVAVIGGGNAAMDAVRTALRMGSDAFILYRRTRDEMPAIPSEIEAAEEEGVQFQFLVAPVRIIGVGGKAKAIECQKMKLGDPDKSGRRSPVPIEGSNFTIEVDNVIPAISQAPDMELFGPGEIAVTKWGTFKVDPANLTTNIPGVFAGGDAVTGPASAIEAMAAGNKAARYIEKYIKGEGLEPDGSETEPYIITLDDIKARMKGVIPRRERLQRTLLPLAKRRTTFEEVEKILTEEEAREEASRCVNCGPCSLCGNCKRVCLADAINFNDKDEIVELEVGSVILAPGLETFDPSRTPQLGFGRVKNVVTSLQFERIMSASGPTSGHIVRASDGKEPVRIAFAQCVGSRDEKVGNKHCSSVCCMYALKQAIIAKEHQPNIKPTIFYIDIRAYGKEYEDYYIRAKNLGIEFVRSKIASISELPNGDAEVKFDSETGPVDRAFDMAVLSVGFNRCKATDDLARMFDLQLDEHGFVPGDLLCSMETSREGIFACGTFTGPKDIPDTVSQASGAAALAGSVIASRRGELEVKKEYPPERDVTFERPRIGVFICNCGANIGGVVDVPSVVEYAKTLPYVEYVEGNLYTCSQDTQKKIVSIVKEKDLNRVVVAACTPRTHEPLFRNTCREAGLNQYLFEMANIRDQCSWVHMNEEEAATEKAKDLVRMSVSKAKLLQPLPKQLFQVTKKALVIGGGITGIASAIQLSRQGFESVLVERSGKLGGHLAETRYLMDGVSPKGYLDRMIHEVENDPRITVLKNASIKDVKGFVGNFETTIDAAGQERSEKHGVIIVATGGKEYAPSEYDYGKDVRIATQSQLEEMIASGKLSAKSVVMIQCVGARCQERTYCSRICCSQAAKNAVEIKKRHPECEVYVLHKDIRTYGTHEMDYRKAQELGVRFIRFRETEPPHVERSPEGLDVHVEDADLGDAKLSLPADLLVLTVPVVPNIDSLELAKQLKVPLSKDRFFLEAHMKLRPVDFATEGIFIAGTAHWPKFAKECVDQAYAAVSRASTILSKSMIEGEGIVSTVNACKCTGCGLCVDVCPFGAIDVSTGDAVVNEALCKGCGGCVVTCPSGAIQQKNLKDEQIIEMIKSAVIG